MAVTYIIAPDRIEDGLGDEIYDTLNGRPIDPKRALQFKSFLEDAIFSDKIFPLLCEMYKDEQEALAERGFNEFIACCDSDKGYVRKLYAERGQEYCDMCG